MAIRVVMLAMIVTVTVSLSGDVILTRTLRVAMGRLKITLSDDGNSGSDSEW
jgi:hypothetical protein